MSFALRSATRAVPRVATLSAPRAFSSTAVHQKSATETVKDGIKTVDRAVSGKIVDGIDAAGKFPRACDLGFLTHGAAARLTR